MTGIVLWPILGVVFLWFVERVCRHSLTIHAVREGERFWVTIRNEEDVPLDVPVQMLVSVGAETGRFVRAELVSRIRVLGTETKFQCDQKFEVILPSLRPFESFEVSLVTNREEGSLKVTLVGWDLDKSRKRWWFPVLTRKLDWKYRTGQARSHMGAG